MPLISSKGGDLASKSIVLSIRGMRGGVRYQVYASSDGYVLFMASEQAFFKNFCEGIGRPDIFERWPGKKYGDHARGNEELHVFLRDEFKIDPRTVG